MEKIVVYKFTLKEIEKILQDCLNNKEIILIGKSNFYDAISSNCFLEGGEIDKCLAQIVGVEKGEHYMIKNGLVFLPSISIKKTEKSNKTNDINAVIDEIGKIGK